MQAHKTPKALPSHCVANNEYFSLARSANLFILDQSSRCFCNEKHPAAVSRPLRDPSAVDTFLCDKSDTEIPFVVRALDLLRVVRC